MQLTFEQGTRSGVGFYAHYLQAECYKRYMDFHYGWRLHFKSVIAYNIHINLLRNSEITLAPHQVGDKRGHYKS